MRTLRIESPGRTSEAGCIVLLPGAQQRLEAFIEAGFDRAVKASGTGFELILADPEQSHLNDRSWMEPLRQEIVLPVLGSGRPLWLGGISLGGFMALRFAAESPQLPAGLCLIAPYLGSRILAAEILRHPGLDSWSPGEVSPEDDERMVWRYIRGLEAQPHQLFLGLGAQDRFADTQRLLARSLPPDCCTMLEGGHEWAVWRRLWDKFLERLALVRAQLAG